ncbi:unnamed protein product [Dovyalis caffra]|uniref:Uncharacterized protein n=1 Tax=Dovyalis caffra TaxID=77055 RepID=A0AAV1SNE7_9ROSI|nr:unnamed protein product [Dovyalis caffra]
MKRARGFVFKRRLVCAKNVSPVLIATHKATWTMAMVASIEEWQGTGREERDFGFN